MTYNKQNPLRVVTLCSGYDSQCLALNRLKEAYPEFDYTLIAWSEFDPESNTPLDKQPAVVAHKALFPQWADGNLGDMTKIDWEKVPDFDLLFYSTPCQSISQAGLQHGFTEGSGTRSSIIWNVRDAVKVKRPKPEVSFAKLSGIAVRVAKFQKGKTLSDVKKAVMGKAFQFSMDNVEAWGDDSNGKTVKLKGRVTFQVSNPESIIDALFAALENNN